MRLNALFPSKWLRHEDLDGKRHTVVIDRLDTETFGEEGEKPVIFFRGRKKGMVLNKTNAYAIGEEFGDDTEKWVGKEIILFPTRVEFKGKFVPSIRVTIPTAEQPQ